MSVTMPEVEHVYQNHLLDSTRWQRYEPRDDDIIIATSYKSGTTWTQLIVKNLIFGSQSEVPIGDVTLWLDRRGEPLDDVLNWLETRPHRRFIKSHLPLDGLPFHPQAKYIVVGRDARDVFMSLWNHHTNYQESFVAAVNELPGRVGPPLPPPKQDIHDFWKNWMTRGWFEWESEGYPYWGNLHHTKTWWRYRSLENILFVHFNDLLSNLAGEIRRIASFLGIERSAQELDAIAQAVTFANLKRNAGKVLPGSERVWRGGSDTFIFKGTNGRWKGVLTPDELALYSETAAKVLPPGCAAWLEGRREGPGTDLLDLERRAPSGSRALEELS